MTARKDKTLNSMRRGEVGRPHLEGGEACGWKLRRSRLADKVLQVLADHVVYSDISHLI